VSTDAAGRSCSDDAKFMHFLGRTPFQMRADNTGTQSNPQQL
jgi:hypothetical protein